VSARLNGGEPDGLYNSGVSYLVACTTAGVTSSFLACETAFFTRLGVRHVRTVNAKYATSVYGSLKTAKSAVYGLVIPYFDTYRHNKSLL